LLLLLLLLLVPGLGGPTALTVERTIGTIRAFAAIWAIKVSVCAANETHRVTWAKNGIPAERATDEVTEGVTRRGSCCEMAMSMLGRRLEGLGWGCER
jgi:hypothetical protein